MAKFKVEAKKTIRANLTKLSDSSPLLRLGRHACKFS